MGDDVQVTGRDDAQLAELAGIASELASVVRSEKSPLVEEVQVVAEHLAQGRFDVAVVGEFNRGKSTLLNRLTAHGVLPSGVLPVTSIVTELAYADTEAVHIDFEDGREERIDLSRLDDYVTEQENPGNLRKVATARVSLPSPVLKHGAVLVDTPGVGSIFRQSTDNAREAIVRADGAVMVLSADAPMTDAERGLIKLLSRRAERTFFVLNRIDHIEDREDLEDIRWFVESVLREAFGLDQKIYCLSAKTGEGFDEFARDFEHFLATGLGAARLAVAKRDISDLADRICNECDIEDSAMELNATEVEDRLGQFRRASDWQHSAFGDDCVLFAHAAAKVATDMRERLIGEAAISDETLEALHESVKDVNRAELEVAIDRAIEERVRELMEPIRRNQELEVEKGWRKAAERFERATQRRADKLRNVAGELFDVKLRPIRVSQPSAQRARFFYSPPVHEEPQPSMLSRFLRPLLPERRSRARLLDAGDQRFRAEMQRHVERLADDLAQRIADANRQLEVAMDEQVTQVAHAMLRAIERAQSAKTAVEHGQRDQRDRSRRLREIAQRARTVVDIRD